MTKQQAVSFLLNILNNPGYQTAVKLEAIKALAMLGHWDPNADQEGL